MDSASTYLRRTEHGTMDISVLTDISYHDNNASMPESAG